MGGTNISDPLDDIYKDSKKSYEKIKLSKNIFLLTDGQVHDREKCIHLITTNSNKFRIHALGIGNDFDKVLIERSGKLGKGSSSFVENVEKINTVVIETLNKCLRPYLIDIKFNFQNYIENKEKTIIECYPDNNFTYQNEIMNYSFILNENDKIDIDNLKENINVEVEGKDPNNEIKEKISFSNENVIKLENGDSLSKMIIGKALNNNKIFTENEQKETEFAKKYQILSKNTALFAEILNDEPNSKQSKLIKVNLNENNVRGMGRGIMKPRVLCSAVPNLFYMNCASRGIMMSNEKVR